MKKKRESRRNRRKIKLIKINFALFLIAFIIVVFLMPRIVSTAKYVYNTVNEHYFSSQDFYFRSDKLDENHTEFEVTNNWLGAETYRITVNMCSKKNDLAYTESDVDYEITYTCSENIRCTLSKMAGTIVGRKNGGENEDSFTVTIEPSGERELSNNETAWIDIEATSTSPYKQTISGKLILESRTEDIYYEIIDSENSPYLTVNVTNSGVDDATITLTYSPEVVLLDMTSSSYLNSTKTTSQKINNYNYLNSITSDIDSLTTTSIKFYKIDSTKNYSYSSSNTATPVVEVTH